MERAFFRNVEVYIGGKTELALELRYIMAYRQQSRQIRGVGYEGIDQH